MQEKGLWIGQIKNVAVGTRRLCNEEENVYFALLCFDSEVDEAFWIGNAGKTVLMDGVLYDSATPQPKGTHILFQLSNGKPSEIRPIAIS